MDEERILAVLREEPGRPYPLPELLDRLELGPKEGKEAKRTLKTLVQRGVVERDDNRNYRMSRAGLRLEGRIEMDPRGVAYVRPDGRKSQVTAISLLPEDGGQVEHNDRVLVEIVVRGHLGRHYARLVKIIERKKQRHVGVFHRVGGACFVELDIVPSYLVDTYRGRRRPVNDVVIRPEDAEDAVNGQLVEVEIDHLPREGDLGPLARVVQVLGNPGERSAELKKLLVEHELDRGFPEEVEAQASAFGAAPREADYHGRKDLRDLPLVTIDSETAKDFDDAVCAVRDGYDYRLYVAIADVSHYVQPGTPLDDEAYRRGTSTYLTDRAIPMLPEALSNGLCSLNPHVDRLCMVAEMRVDRSGHIKDSTFYRAVMRSHARLTYTRVAQALDGEPDEECARLLPTLLLLSRISAKLLERRLRRGAIDLDLPEPYVVFDAERQPVTAARRPRNDAHRLIEDLMLAANEAVARFLVEQDLPALYRVHEAPDPQKLQLFTGLCEHLGLRAPLSENPKPGEVARLLEEISEQPSGKALHGVLLRSMAQARYEAECKGHYGLAAEHYLHFTSPIRRYPDLVVHRVLKDVTDGKAPRYGLLRLQEMGERSSEAERRAMGAERSSLELDRALIAQRHIGETYPGTITGVQGFGLFVALDEPFLEGMVPVQTLPDDFYELDDYGASLQGRETGKVYRLGDRVEAQVASVSVARRQVELRVIDTVRAAGPKRKVGLRRGGEAPRSGRGDRGGEAPRGPKPPGAGEQRTRGAPAPKGRPGKPKKHGKSGRSGRGRSR